MDGRLPLHALLSQALVAFTIEIDNEAEHQIPHRTTNHGATAAGFPRLWLTSMVMWMNCMRFVDDRGVTGPELERLARTHTNLHGMQRWGYITIGPDPADRRPKPPRSSWIIRPTLAGKHAKQIWPPLFAVIENRWRERFGQPEIAALREALSALIPQIDPELPDCLPILGYGLYSQKLEIKHKTRAREETEKEDEKGTYNATGNASSLPLPALLSKALLAFAIEFEGESEVSLAICANVLRLFNAGVGSEHNADRLRVKDLPRLSGVSKEAIAMALTFLTKRGYATVGPESPASRTKALTLTPKGRHARDSYHQLVADIEKRWQPRFGKDVIHRLRQSLDPLVGETNQKSPLFQGLEPYPGNWRASIPRPETLPHYPMVLHRGGYPDGS